MLDVIGFIMLGVVVGFICIEILYCLKHWDE
jgi:hypothetical protein